MGVSLMFSQQNNGQLLDPPSHVKAGKWSGPGRAHIWEKSREPREGLSPPCSPSPQDLS